MCVGRHAVPLTVQLCYQGNEHNPIANFKDIVVSVSVQRVCFTLFSSSPFSFPYLLVIDSQDIDESTLHINSFGVAEVKVTFLQLSLTHNNRKFVFRFSIKADELQALPNNASSPKTDGTSTSVDASFPMDLTVVTTPMLVIRLRLQLQMELNNAQVEDFAPIAGGNINTAANIWYKDEGGKDHGIDLTISVIAEEDGEPITSLPHPIPYMITLLYSTGDAVLYNHQKGSIFTILPDPNAAINPLNALTTNTVNPSVAACVIDPSTGSNTKRIRINDISKNHQRQNFILRITPDITKLKQPYVYSSDIAPVDSLPIEVRSKRTKRPRAEDELEGEGVAILPATTTATNSSSAQKPSKNSQSTSATNANQASAVTPSSSQLMKKLKPDGKPPKSLLLIVIIHLITFLLMLSDRFSSHWK